MPATDPRPGDAEHRAVHDGFRWTAALLLVLLAITGTVQYTAADSGLGARLRATSRVLWPQQWAFFAAESDPHLLAAYRFGPGGSLAPGFVAQRSASNRWGLGGVSSAQFIELETIGDRVPAEHWVHCADATATCAARAATVVLANDFRPALLCGPVVLVRPGTGDPGGTVAVVDLICTGG